MKQAEANGIDNQSGSILDLIIIVSFAEDRNIILNNYALDKQFASSVQCVR